MEYTIYSRNGSWFDPHFAARQNASLWDVVMETKICDVRENPVLILEDGNLELTSGNFTLLPFDTDVKILKGTKASFYVHGTARGAVLFGHPITDFQWRAEDVSLDYCLQPFIEPKNRELVQFLYRPQSTCVPTETDDFITVYAGTMNFELDHFSTFNSILQRNDVQFTTVAIFCGVVCYHKIGEPA